MHAYGSGVTVCFACCVCTPNPTHPVPQDQGNASPWRRGICVAARQLGSCHEEYSVPIYLFDWESSSHATAELAQTLVQRCTARYDTTRLLSAFQRKYVHGNRVYLRTRPPFRRPKDTVSRPAGQMTVWIPSNAFPHAALAPDGCAMAGPCLTSRCLGGPAEQYGRAGIALSSLNGGTRQESGVRFFFRADPAEWCMSISIPFALP